MSVGRACSRARKEGRGLAFRGDASTGEKTEENLSQRVVTDSNCKRPQVAAGESMIANQIHGSTTTWAGELGIKYLQAAPPFDQHCELARGKYVAQGQRGRARTLTADREKTCLVEGRQRITQLTQTCQLLQRKLSANG